MDRSFDPPNVIPLARYGTACRKFRRYLGRFCAIVASCSFGACVLAGETEYSGGIPYSEIKKRGVLGRLGVPLGKVVEIEVVYVAPPPQKGMEFARFVQVKTVQGVALPHDVLMEIRSSYYGAELGKVGDTARLIVFESGAFRGTPSDALKHTPPVADSNFGFYLFLQCVAVKGK